MKIGIICAMKIEVDALKASIKNATAETIARIDFVTGTINNVEVVAVECGVGKVNSAICTQIMIDKYAPDYIVNSGIAGSLSSVVGIADIVIADNVVQHDMNITALGNKMGEIEFNDEKRINIPTDTFITEKIKNACNAVVDKDTKVIVGTIATGDIFVSGKEKRATVATRFNALACEMEGGSIGQVCYRNGVPFSVLRCISDDFDERYFMDYSEFSKISANKTIAILNNFLQNM